MGYCNIANVTRERFVKANFLNRTKAAILLLTALLRPVFWVTLLFESSVIPKETEFESVVFIALWSKTSSMKVLDSDKAANQ